MPCPCPFIEQDSVDGIGRSTSGKQQPCAEAQSDDDDDETIASGEEASSAAAVNTEDDETTDAIAKTIADAITSGEEEESSSPELSTDAHWSLMGKNEREKMGTEESPSTEEESSSTQADGAEGASELAMRNVRRHASSPEEDIDIDALED
jgi:hypothetical protein